MDEVSYSKGSTLLLNNNVICNKIIGKLKITNRLQILYEVTESIYIYTFILTLALN